jgi:hypothetical protein
MAAELGEYLGAISQDEVNQGRPMLSAIAVNSQGKPSKGFFDWAQQLGRFIGGDATTQDAFWKREKEAVYKTWQRSFDKPS